MQGTNLSPILNCWKCVQHHPVTCDIDACFHVKCGYHKCNIIYLTQWLIFEQWNTPMLGKHLKATPMINIQWCISFRMCGIGQKTSRRLYTITARRKNRRSSWSGSTISKITYGIPAPHVEEMQINSLRVWSQCHCTSATSTKDSMATSSTLDASMSLLKSETLLLFLLSIRDYPLVFGFMPIICIYDGLGFALVVKTLNSILTCTDLIFQCCLHKYKEVKSNNQTSCNTAPPKNAIPYL